MLAYELRCRLTKLHSSELIGRRIPTSVIGPVLIAFRGDRPPRVPFIDAPFANERGAPQRHPSSYKRKVTDALKRFLNGLVAQAIDVTVDPRGEVFSCKRASSQRQDDCLLICDRPAEFKTVHRQRHFQSRVADALVAVHERMIPN